MAALKLFTIGDSISQGFVHFAAADAENCYSTLLARRVLKLDPYVVPAWAAGGFPLKLERVMRLLDRYGADVSGPFEWTSALLAIGGYADEVETEYERGGSAHWRVEPGGIANWANVAYFGMDVGDAWKLTPRICRQVIDANPAGAKDDRFGLASDAFYRSALRTLDPGHRGWVDPATPGNNSPYLDYSAVRWLKHHAEAQGVENVILWAGANNALGTVLRLRVKQTSGDRSIVGMSHLERARFGFNLWHPDDFEAEYAELLDQVDAALAGNRVAKPRVFVGTVPYVTIAPLAKGVGPTTFVEGFGHYFKYYVYFPFEAEDVDRGVNYLPLHDAIMIDRCIERYNATIRELVAARNAALGYERYVVVDLCDCLTQLAWKRNGGNPTYAFPDYFKFRLPQPNTKFYYADRAGDLKQGGIFGLDGVHPTPIGHGLVAWEFLKVMARHGVTDAFGTPVTASDLDAAWPDVVRADTLYTHPIRQMGELYENRKLIRWVLNHFGAFDKQGGAGSPPVVPD
jgi:hypothetical protein